MAVEWWTLIGKTEELEAKLTENKKSYCKLKGVVLHTKTLLKRGPCMNGYHVSYFTFDIEDILWVKTEGEIIEINKKIADLTKEAENEFESKRYKNALQLIEEAKILAKEFLPNTFPHNILAKEKICQDYVRFKQSESEFKNKKEWLEFLNKIASDYDNREAYLRKDTEIIGSAGYKAEIIARIEICDLMISSIQKLNNLDKEIMEEMIIGSMENELKGEYASPSKILFNYANILVKLGGKKSLEALLKYNYLYDEFRVNGGKRNNLKAEEESQQLDKWIEVLKEKKANY